MPGPPASLPPRTSLPGSSSGEMFRPMVLGVEAGPPSGALLAWLSAVPSVSELILIVVAVSPVYRECLLGMCQALFSH